MDLPSLVWAAVPDKEANAANAVNSRNALATPQTAAVPSSSLEATFAAAARQKNTSKTTPHAL